MHVRMNLKDTVYYFAWILFLLIMVSLFSSYQWTLQFDLKGPVQKNTLLNIMKLQPKENSIYFIQTVRFRNENNKIIITDKQACAVESAAILNPTFDVYLLYEFPGEIGNEDTHSDRNLQILLNYKNVKINYFNFEQYSKGTPVENMFNSESLETPQYPTYAIRNIIRLLTLWKYGGICIDLDVVLIKPLDTLEFNYAAFDGISTVRSSVISCSVNGSGHNFTQKCLEEFQSNFTAFTPFSGNLIVTKVLQQVCNVEKVSQMIEKCTEFKVYPPAVFYPVQWKDWLQYSDPTLANKFLEDVYANSYAINLWNDISQLSVAIYESVASKHCPRIFTDNKLNTFATTAVREDRNTGVSSHQSGP